MASGLDPPSAEDVRNSNGISERRLSVGSFTAGLWEYAIQSVINFASVRKRVTREESESSTPTTPTGLPPLPVVPPVGPARHRPRSCAVGRCHSLGGSPPRLVRQNGVSEMQVLPRSQSVADVFSAAMATGLCTTGRRAAPRLTRASSCQECGRRFTLMFRRHHCRMCERSVCASCSAYQQVRPDIEEEDSDSAKEREPVRCSDGYGETPEEADHPKNVQKSVDRNGKKSHQRVCRKCVLENEVRQPLHCRSWLEEFADLRLFFKRERHLGEDWSSPVHLPVRIPRLPERCKTLAVTFVEDHRKSAQQKVRFLASSSSFNSGLQYALKPQGQKMCGTCAKLLRFPIERKTCTVCDEVFCRNCSSRDLALSLSDDLDRGDINHEVSQVEARILYKEESEELDKTSNPTIWHVNGGWNQRFRVCNGCLGKIKQELNAIDFNDSLTRLQAELVDLQEQIAAVLDDEENSSPVSGLSRWPSVRSVHTYTSAEEEIAGEVVSFKVTQKLLERFLHVYLQLERLRPETSSQTMLFRHVKQAMTSFYMSRRSMAAKRFHRHESHISLPSPYFNL